MTKEEYRDGFYLYPFVLSLTQILDECAEIPVEGVLKLEIRFSIASTESMTLIVFSEFDTQIHIDKDSNMNVGILAKI